MLMLIYKAVVHPDCSLSQTYQAALKEDGEVYEWIGGPWPPVVLGRIVPCGTDEKFTIFCDRDFSPSFRANPFGIKHPFVSLVPSGSTPAVLE